MAPRTNGDRPQDLKAAEAGKPPVDFTAVMKDAPKANPDDPRVAMANKVTAAYDLVAREEQDPKLKTSFAHGEHLRNLGDLDIQNADLGNGRAALELAAQTMHDAKDKPANGENILTNTLADFASSLTRRDKETPTLLSQSAAVMQGVVDRAKMEHRPPSEVASFLQQKATTELDIAQNIHKRAPGDTRYLASLTSASTDLNDGLNLLAKDSNNGKNKLAEARLRTELGFADKQINDVDRNNWYNKLWGAGLVGYGQLDSASEYTKAVDLYNQFKPANEQQKVELDAEKATTLGRYLQSADTKDKRYPEMDKQLNEIAQQHPDWRLKF